MASKNKKISALIDQQLPGFISSEYGNFSKFVEKYYEQLESTGQPIDIINNITKYSDINYYEENLLIFLISVLLSTSPLRYFSGKAPKYCSSKFLIKAYKNKLLILYTSTP